MDLGKKLSSGTGQQGRGTGALPLGVLRKAERSPAAASATLQVVGDRFVFQSEVLFPSASGRSAAAAARSSSPASPSACSRSAASIPKEVNLVLQVDGHTDNKPIKHAPLPVELGTFRGARHRRREVPATARASRNDRLVAAGYGESSTSVAIGHRPQPPHRAQAHQPVAQRRGGSRRTPSCRDSDASNRGRQRLIAAAATAQQAVASRRRCRRTSEQHFGRRSGTAIGLKHEELAAWPSITLNWQMEERNASIKLAGIWLTLVATMLVVGRARPSTRSQGLRKHRPALRTVAWCDPIPGNDKQVNCHCTVNKSFILPPPRNARASSRRRKAVRFARAISRSRAMPPAATTGRGRGASTSRA